MTQNSKPQRNTESRSTIRQVAELAGVDVSLVSRVLNDHPKATASQATRERIIRAASTLAYQPNLAAKGLRMSRTWTLGLLLPNLMNPMYAEIARAVEHRALERGYGVIFGTHVESLKEEPFTHLLSDRRVDGLLIASGVVGDEHLRRFVSERHGSVVLLNRKVRGIEPAVTVDDKAGAALAVHHLFELGHRSIGGIVGPDDIDTSRRRRKGLLMTAESMGMRVKVVETNGWDISDGFKATLELLANHHEISAIFASSFSIGIGALRGAAELSLRIPQDIAVIALHDFELADYLTPRLTTIALPVVEMAHRAVDTLIDLIHGSKTKNHMITTPPRLVPRESTVISNTDRYVHTV